MSSPPCLRVLYVLESTAPIPTPVAFSVVVTLGSFGISLQVARQFGSDVPDCLGVQPVEVNLEHPSISEKRHTVAEPNTEPELDTDAMLVDCELSPISPSIAPTNISPSHGDEVDIVMTEWQAQSIADSTEPLLLSIARRQTLRTDILVARKKRRFTLYPDERELVRRSKRRSHRTQSRT